MPEKILLLKYNLANHSEKKQNAILAFFNPRLSHQWISSKTLYGYIIETILLEFNLMNKRQTPRLTAKIQSVCDQYCADYIVIDPSISRLLHLTPLILPNNLITSAINSCKGFDSCIIIDDENAFFDIREIAKDILDKLNALTVITRDKSRWAYLEDFAFREYGLFINFADYDTKFVFVIAKKGCFVLDFSSIFNHFELMKYLPKNTLYFDCVPIRQYELDTARKDISFINLFKTPVKTQYTKRQQ